MFEHSSTGKRSSPQLPQVVGRPAPWDCRTEDPGILLAVSWRLPSGPRSLAIPRYVAHFISSSQYGGLLLQSQWTISHSRVLRQSLLSWNLIMRVTSHQLFHILSIGSQSQVPAILKRMEFYKGITHWRSLGVRRMTGWPFLLNRAPENFLLPFLCQKHFLKILQTLNRETSSSRCSTFPQSRN